MLVLKDWPQYTRMVVLYAVLSLTVVRMVPVAIALMGTRLSPASVMFMGWFGPRGIGVDRAGVGIPGAGTVSARREHDPLGVIVTVALSIFAHGFSAVPGIGLYARKIAALGPDAPEHQEVRGHKRAPIGGREQRIVFSNVANPLKSGRSPTPGLLFGLVVTLAAVVAYTGYITYQIKGLRELQSNIIDRNRKDSLQLLRIQNDLNSAGDRHARHARQYEPYPLSAWAGQFQRIRQDLAMPCGRKPSCRLLTARRNSGTTWRT